MSASIGPTHISRDFGVSKDRLSGDFPDLAVSRAAPLLQARLPNPLNWMPLELRLNQVKQALAARSLTRSFEAHVNLQLAQKGHIEIGLIDDFRPGRTHGLNVEQRIRANAPPELKGRIGVKRYDIGGLTGDRRAAVMQLAAADAQAKRVVALSLSGGMEPYKVDSIQTWIGRPLDDASAGHAFNVISDKAKLSPTKKYAWDQINLASKRIPVVTPIWNDGRTTLGALRLGSHSSNGLVTSIDSSSSSRATEIPGLDLIRMPAQVGNGFASQSAAVLIGQMLWTVDIKLIPTPQPGPRPGSR